MQSIDGVISNDLEWPLKVTRLFKLKQEFSTSPPPATLASSTQQTIIVCNR